MITHAKSASMDGSQWVSSSSYPELQSAMPGGHVDSRLNPVKFQGSPATREQLIQAGQEFESYFISYLLKVMRETVPEGALENKQGAYFYSFYDEEIGKRAAQSGGIGIARMVQEYADKYFSSSPAKGSSSGG